MSSPLVVGSDARVVSLPFTDLDEIPTATDATPTLAVSSVLDGALATPTVEAVPGQPGFYRAVLTAATHLAQPDVLTLSWVGAVGGHARSLTQVVEVAGGVYVAADQLAAMRTVPDVNGSMGDVLMWRANFERMVEQARGVAYVPRLAVEDYEVGRWPITLRQARPREIKAVWVDGVAQDVADYDFDAATYALSGYFAAPLRIAYTHGHDAPPGALVQACREWVRAMVLSDASDHQRTLLSVTNMASGETYRFGTADWSAGRFTGMDTVDALINSVPDERIPGLA